MVTAKGTTHKGKNKTSKTGTGRAKRKKVAPKVEPPDPPKPANLSYATLDKHATHGASFKYTWELGAAINAKKTQYHATITTKGWVGQNIIKISVPEIPKVNGQRLHRLVAGQFTGFYKAAAKKGLASKVLSNEGGFYPRTITNNSKSLSNHALGTAVDINAAQNGFGAAPAKRGTNGSVRELADFCADFGLYWGGWYQRSKDGMHFEAVTILDEAQLKAACTKHDVPYAEVVPAEAAAPAAAPAPPAKAAKP